MNLYGKHTKDVADRILSAFQEPGRLPKALAPIFIHRTDDVPCRAWSWHNQLITALSGTIDARGFRQWQSVGRQVCKGKHAIWILAPCIKKITDKASDETRSVLVGFKSIPVFALEDTEGDAVPDTDDACSQFISELPLLDVAESWGLKVDGFTHSAGTPMGFYSHGFRGQAIMLGVENLSTWAHELVHAADDRLTKLSGNKTQREVVAELGGAILLECLGKSHDADLGGAFEYIESYARAEKLSVIQGCVKVLGRTCDCVKLILDEAAKLEPVAV